MQYTSEILAQLDDAGLGNVDIQCNIPQQKSKPGVRKFRERNAN